MPPLPAPLLADVTRLPGLRVLVLHGSRANGRAHVRSDWDFAYLADPGFDVEGLRALLVEGLGDEQIDLADLSRAGALLRHRVASSGAVVHERTAGEFQAFQVDAAQVWCDLVPVLGPAYERVLGALAR
jgi:predicted nucleotidyltransferase